MAYRETRRTIGEAALTASLTHAKLPPLESRKIKQIAPALLEWFAANARDLPWRRSRDPYAIWISEIMLQQTQVKTVIPYFDRWLAELPTVTDFANAPESKILKLWEGLGYYSRVRNAQAAAKQIVDQHGARFPEDLEHILALPGVGRYTAGAISSIAFNKPVPILDGNVIRVVARLFGVEGSPRDKETNARFWQLAERLVEAAPQNCSELNQSLMELGALICTPRQPQCLFCPVRQQCFAYETGRIGEFPVLVKRPKITPRRFVSFIAEREGKYLVRQRPEGVVNARFWEFPNAEDDGRSLGDIRLDFEVTESGPLCTIRHSITRYRIQLEAYRARVRGKPAGAWHSIAEMKKLPFTSAHKKILAKLDSV